MAKINPLVASGYFSTRDLYPNVSNTSTREETAPEQSEQDALANSDSGSVNAKKNSTSIWLWIGIIVAVIIFLNLK